MSPGLNRNDHRSRSEAGGSAPAHPLVSISGWPIATGRTSRPRAAGRGPPLTVHEKLAERPVAAGVGHLRFPEDAVAASPAGDRTPPGEHPRPVAAGAS